MHEKGKCPAEHKKSKQKISVSSESSSGLNDEALGNNAISYNLVLILKFCQVTF
jgi:hypothetical protein